MYMITLNEVRRKTQLFKGVAIHFSLAKTRIRQQSHFNAVWEAEGAEKHFCFQSYAESFQ